jgi:hypothetical protein
MKRQKKRENTVSISVIVHLRFCPYLFIGFGY